MITLKKEELLFYFPYAPQKNNVVQENKSIYDVLRQIEIILWEALAIGNSDRPGDIELKLIDYQADIAERKKYLEKMRGELNEKEKKRAEKFGAESQKVINRHVPKNMQGRFNGNVPFNVADNPEVFENQYNQLKEDFKDLLDRQKEIQEAFEKKMEGISKIKLPNTDPFTKDEIKHLKGQLVKAVRPLMITPKPAKNGKEKQPA